MFGPENALTRRWWNFMVLQVSVAILENRQFKERNAIMKRLSIFYQTSQVMS